MELKLAQIRIDGGTQPRVEINEEILTEYAEHLRNGVTFPPVTVFFDGAAYWLADGFHRYHAHRRIGRDTITADIHDGGLREAILYSVGTNTEHGLRRTNEDKRKAVETMLNNEIVSKDETGKLWCDSDIARQCHVHHTTVGRIRKELSCAMHKMDSPERLVKRGNSTYLQNTSNIGKRKGRLTQPPRNAKLKPSVAKLGHSLPNPMIQVTLPPKNPKAAAAGIAALFSKEFIRQFIVELSVYVTENTHQSGEHA